MISKKQTPTFYFLILLISSIGFNQYYGFIGINPIDSFFSFNSGYDILNGSYPFKDYWTITGPFISYIQAFFFKFFGVSWFSYVFHASVYNFIFTIIIFYTLNKFNLNIHYSFFYSFLISLLSYPSSGTPYVDHQSTILSVISVLIFILALKTKNNIYWFVLPIVLAISFLTKQTPTGHIIVLITFLSVIHFIFNFNLRNILLGFAGSIVIITIFFITIYLTKTPFSSFVEQYILFPISLGESRLDFLFPIEFKRFFLRFKLIHLSSAIILFICIKKILGNYKYIAQNEFLILVSLIGLSYFLIAHQLMTINGKYIYFIIPILIGFSHIYYLKYFSKKKYILFLLIFLSFSSTIYYGYKYIHKRDFMDLRNANINNSINAQTLDTKLKGLKWITPIYPNDPKKEINLLKEAINIINKDKRKKVIITDYQFISVILSINDNSPSQVWFDYHTSPIRGSKYFNTYKTFFINKLKLSEIEVIYLVKPLWGGNEVLESVMEKDCFTLSSLTEIVNLYNLKNCRDIIN